MTYIICKLETLRATRHVAEHLFRGQDITYITAAHQVTDRDWRAAPVVSFGPGTEETETAVINRGGWVWRLDDSPTYSRSLKEGHHGC